MAFEVLGEHGWLLVLGVGGGLWHAVPLRLAQPDGLPARVQSIAQDAVFRWGYKRNNNLSFPYEGI